MDAHLTQRLVPTTLTCAAKAFLQAHIPQLSPSPFSLFHSVSFPVALHGAARQSPEDVAIKQCMMRALEAQQGFYLRQVRGEGAVLWPVVSLYQCVEARPVGSILSFYAQTRLAYKS